MEEVTHAWWQAGGRKEGRLFPRPAPAVNAAPTRCRACAPAGGIMPPTVLSDCELPPMADMMDEAIKW